MENKPTVVLASASPRRKLLLEEIFDDFEIAVPDVDETLHSGETLSESAIRLSRLKAATIALVRPGAWIIAADTLVGIEENQSTKIFGKPTSSREAVETLGQLSGRVHHVVTGVTVRQDDRESYSCDVTLVQFRQLNNAEIESYVDSGEPMDKAGSYAIQGGAAKFVERIDGSLSNVVGLPLERLRVMLKDFVSREGGSRLP